MKNFVFSFENYIRLLDLLTLRGGVQDYRDIISGEEPFIILRHDVEFSPRRAYELAKVEKEYGIYSTYFFQISNNAYNILSKENKDRIIAIHKMGHKVGLHFHLHGSDDLEEIKQRIQYECHVMSYVLGLEIDRFSFHRPSRLVLENVVVIPEMINAYAPPYFTYSKNIQDIDFSNNIKYISDSQGRWNYLVQWDSPCHEFFELHPRIQILCHPYLWTRENHDTLGNLKSLIDENKQEFTNTLISEAQYVKEYMNEL